MKKICTLLLFLPLFCFSQKEKAALFTTTHFSGKLIRQINKKATKMYGVSVKWVGRMTLTGKYDGSYFADDFTEKLSGMYIDKKYQFTIGLTNVPLIAVKIDDEFNIQVKELHGRTDTVRSSIITDNLVADTYDRNQDITNIVMHEMGHLMGLGHCENPYCLMIGYGHLSNSKLCYSCQQKLKK